MFPAATKRPGPAHPHRHPHRHPPRHGLTRCGHGAKLLQIVVFRRPVLQGGIAVFRQALLLVTAAVVILSVMPNAGNAQDPQADLFEQVGDEVHFTGTPASCIQNVERYGLEDGQVVTLSRRVTDSNTAGVGLISQLLGNLTNFDPAQQF